MSFPLRFALIIGLLLLAAGCTPTPTPAPAVAQPAATAVEDPTDAPTALPPTAAPEADEPQPAPTEEPAPVEQQPFAATVNVDSLNVRSGPGTLFEVLLTLPLGSNVTALGTAPGHDWIEIKSEDGQTGWVYAELLTLGGELASLPLLETPPSLSINGKVIDQNGQSINGVQVQVTAQLFDFAVKFVTLSNADGYFYTFFPPDTVGVWLVEIIGTDCESRIVDGNCNVVEYFLYNGSAYVQLPAVSPLVFVYEAASSHITGTVQDTSGAALSNMRVFATRSDGATAEALSSNTGSFVLPTSPGIWEVYAVQTTPYLEGERFRVDAIADYEPASITILSPVEEEIEEETPTE
jgi:SH3-like domain-containing protein